MISMKAPKGWAKTFTGKRTHRWTNIHNSTIVELRHELGDYFVNIVGVKNGQEHERSSKSFYVKRAALDYAERWMKKHPKG